MRTTSLRGIKLKCPEGHTATAETEEDEAICDICEKDINGDEIKWTCRECDWDLCAKCATGPGQTLFPHNPKDTNDSDADGEWDNAEELDDEGNPIGNSDGNKLLIKRK